MSTATITLTATDIQGILEDMNPREIVESFSYSKYNGVEIEWNIRCEPIEWEVDDVVDVDEYDRLEEMFKDLQVDFDQLTEVHDSLKIDFDQLNKKHDALNQMYDQLVTDNLRLQDQLNAPKQPWFKKLFKK